MVLGFGFGLGQRRRRIPEDPSVVARAEVKFWKTELDRCVEEKQHWIARAANAHRQNEVLRTEVCLLQQDVRQLQEVLSLPGASKPSISQLQTPHQHHRDQNPSHHQTPSRSRTHRGVPTAVPQVQTSRQQTSARPPQPQPQPPPPPAPTTPEAGAAEDDEFVDFTPAAKRFQSPGTVIAAGSASSNSRPAQSSQDEAARWRDEANSLRKYLQEARSLNESLRQQLTQQQHREQFLRSIAEAHKNEAQQLQDKLLTSHGLNDETADETVKLLAELGRAQQSNALLKRDLAFKDELIQLLQQQVAELSSQVLPHSPRSGRGRSAERTTFSASACSHSPDGHASPRLHDPVPLHAACADIVAGESSSDAFPGSTATHSIDSYAFHHYDDALDYVHHTAVDAHALPLNAASPAGQSPSRLSLSSRPHSRPRSLPHSRQHSRPHSARPSRGTDVDHLPLPPDDETDLELAGMVAVHAAMYRQEKEALRQSQEQLEAALAATRYEVAAHETGLRQMEDGMACERLNSLAALWKPPKPRTRSWREPEGQEIDPMSLLLPGARIPCSCGDDCEEHPMGLGGGDGAGALHPRLGAAPAGSAAAGAAAQNGKASGKAGADKGAGAGSGAATRAPPRQQLGGRLAKDSAFGMPALAHVEQQPLTADEHPAAKPAYQQAGSQFAAARCALERKTSPVFELEPPCSHVTAQGQSVDAGLL